jgi:hypothetical protein
MAKRDKFRATRREAEVAGMAGEPSRRRSDDAEAFMPDPEEGPARVDDDLAETLAEDFVRSATTGEDADDEVLEEVVPEELGGPFVETTAGEEYATGTDASNPEDAAPEPLPRVMRGLTDKLPRE